MANNTYASPDSSARSILRDIRSGVVWAVKAPFRALRATADVASGPIRAATISTLDKPDVWGTADALQAAKSALVGTPNDDALKSAAEGAAKAYNNAVNHLNVTRGGLGASVKNLGRSIARTFGADVSGWGSTHIPENVEEHARSVLGRRVGFTERIMSKPFRVAANHPKTALFLGAAALTAGIASWLRGSREEDTQRDMMQSAAEAQMLAAQAMRSRRGEYYNSVPEGVYTSQVEPLMRHSDGAQPNHAQAVRSAVAAAQQQPA